jgi:hypothetical protein
MLSHAAVVLALAVIRLGWVHFHEFRECRWCRRGGLLGGSWPAILAGHRPRRRRRRGCWRCRGMRLTRRWGAWHTHKLALSLRRAWAEWRDR